MGKVVLEKILLKNWHAFEDNIFDISELSTLITGMNASGKTTLLDAISVILDGANSHDFNVAVKDEGERRTISGALHYVISGEPLRTGKVTGLILAQFYDENYNARFLNGVFLVSKSYTSDSSIDQRFFSVINMSVDNPAFKVDFDKCKIPGQVSYPNKKTAFEEYFRLRKMQHIKPDMYKGLVNSVLRAKLDCTPGDFVRKNILPEDDKISSIESIKNNYRLLDDRERLYEELSEEAECLKKIRNNWYQLKNGETNYAILALIRQKLAKQQLEDSNEEKKSLQETVTNIKRQKEQLEESLTELSVRYGEYKSIDIITEKRKEQAILNRELLTLKTEMDRVNKSVYVISELAKEMKSGRRFTKESPDSDVNELLETSDAFIDDLDDNIIRLKEKKQKIKKEMSEANTNLSELRKGKFVSTGFSGIGNRISAAKDLAKTINEYFNSHGIDDVARLLYELIDGFEDKTWQPAIEMLLGGRRVHVVVKPENESAAVRLQNTFAAKADTDIILGSKLRSITPLKKSVATQLKSKSEVANLILNAYYGNHILCDSIEEYAQHDFAIMKSGMFKNKVNSHKPARALSNETFLLGGDTIKEYTAETETRLSALRKQDGEAVNELNRLISQKRMINKLISEVRVHLPIDTTVSDEFCSKQKALASLKQEIEELSKASEGSITEKIGSEIKEVKAKIATINKENEMLLTKEIKIAERINHLEKLVNDSEKQLLLIETGNIQQEQIDEFYSSMSEDDKSLDDISKRQNDYLNKGKTISEKIKMNQTEYNKNFGKCLKVGLETDTYIAYLKRLQYLEGKAFMEIREEVNKLKSSLIESKAGVFKGIAESFQFAMDEVEKIKAILKLYEISGNRFKIHLGPSARRRDLYQAITAFANEENVSQNIIDRLDICFDKMINSKDANTFNDLADYRNYLDCDVMISNVERKTWKSFSSEKGSFSGGQKETPYYMCLAAALSCKAYTKGGIRLIVLDEAFKNMDQINKVKALSMFKHLNLQTLLFTSNSDLSDCTENIYVITKFDNRIVTAFGRNGNSLKVMDQRIKV